MGFNTYLRRDTEENFDLQVIFFIGGEGKRIKEVAYKHVLPSKQWLPIAFDEDGEPIPLLFKNFQILMEAGLKNFYFLALDGSRCFDYFKQRFGNDLSYNIQFLPQEELSKIEKGEKGLIKEEGKVNIYIIETGKKGNAVELLYLYKLGIVDPIFLRVYGDEYLEIKDIYEIKSFLWWGINKIEKEGAVSVFACVPKDKVKNKNLEQRLFFDIGKSDELFQNGIGNFVLTSLTIHSTKFIDLIEELGAIYMEDQNLIDHASNKKFGKVINVEFFVNVNTKEDYKTLQNLLGLPKKSFDGLNKKNLKEKN